MRFKSGVSIWGASPEIAVAMMVINDVYHEVVGHGATFTAVTDGKHNGHQHSLGYAVDVRTRDDNSTQQWPTLLKNRLAEEIKNRLTDEYDIVIHSTHIHIELDRR